MSSSLWLLSLARQRLPLPAIAVAAGTYPLPVSVLACHCCRVDSRPLPVSVRPCLPLLLLLPPPTAADAPGRSLPSAAALAVLPPPSPSLQPPSSSAATIIVATKPSLPPPPPPNLVLFGQSTFSRTEESYHQEVRSKRVLNLFMAQLLGKWNLFRDFQQVQIYSIAHKNQKRTTTGTHSLVRGLEEQDLADIFSRQIIFLCIVIGISLWARQRFVGKLVHSFFVPFLILTSSHVCTYVDSTVGMSVHQHWVNCQIGFIQRMQLAHTMVFPPIRS